MPGPLYAFNAAALGKKIYAIGGRGKDERHDRYTYVCNTTTDSWEVKKEPLLPRSNHAIASLEDKVFVFGGNDSPDEAEVYDPGTDGWEELPPFLVARRKKDSIFFGLRGEHGIWVQDAK
jgi:kelch-like protein 9/13